MAEIEELKKKCKELERYQGWTNYETWLTGLWIDNDFGLYSEITRLTEEHANKAKDDENVKAGIWTECEAAKFRLADDIKEKIEEGNPLAEKADLYSDILGANLKGVDWDEIAESYLEDKMICKKNKMEVKK